MTTPDLILKELNASYLRVICKEKHIEQELYDFFTFEVPGSQWDPRVKSRVWDGKKHLYNKKTKSIYSGLRERIEIWAKGRYMTHYEPLKKADNLTQLDPRSFVNKIQLPDHIKDRWYQFSCFEHAIRYRRDVTLLSTAAGKSLILYLLTRYYDKKTLIVVHTLGLVTQMYKHFKEYGYDVDKNVHCVYQGMDKSSDKPVVIATWQSIYNNPPDFFNDYEVVIGDEVHLFAAKSLQTIMSNCRNAYHRFGFTGTLEESKCHRLVLEGLFGNVYQPTTTTELADQGFIVPPKVSILVLHHSEEDRKAVYKAEYQQELDFICQMEKRNRYLSKLAFVLKGNTLILFRLIAKHGELLYKMMETGNNYAYPIHYVHGGTEKDERELIRQTISANKNSISICSYGVFSTGIDIPNIDNIIFASPYKSKVKVLQSIGRGLRLSKGKTKCKVYDIVDDLRYKGKNNHTVNHYLERLRYYNLEKFEYTEHRIEI